MTEDEMFGWHYPFHGHEFEQALGVGGGSWGRKQTGTTYVSLFTYINLSEYKFIFHLT